MNDEQQPQTIDDLPFNQGSDDEAGEVIADPDSEIPGTVETAETPDGPTAPSRWTPTPHLEMKTALMAVDPERENALARELSSCLRELEAKELAKKAFDKEIGTEIQELKQRAFKLGRAVGQGVEENAVRCRWYHDHLNSLAQLRREDSGEVVEQRSMTDSERQMQLAIDEDRHPDDQEGTPEEPEAGQSALSFGVEVPQGGEPAQEMGLPIWDCSCDDCSREWTVEMAETEIIWKHCPHCDSATVNLQRREEVENIPGIIPDAQEAAIPGESEGSGINIPLRVGDRGTYKSRLGAIVAIVSHRDAGGPVGTSVTFRADGTKGTRGISVGLNRFLEGFTPEQEVDHA